MMDDLDACAIGMKKTWPLHEHDDQEKTYMMVVEDKDHQHIYLEAELPSCPDPQQKRIRPIFNKGMIITG
jgi:hypothetical protein